MPNLPPQLSLMVIATNLLEDRVRPPMFLVQEDDLWRNMGSPEPIREQGIQDRFGTATPTLEDIEAHIDHTLMEQLDTETFAEETLGELKDLGMAVFKALLSKELRDRMKEIAGRDVAGSPKKLPILRVYSHPLVEWIPWELMHDGKDFLGLRYQIARLPILMAVEVTYKRREVRRQVSVANVTNFLADGLLTPEDARSWQDTFACVSGKVNEVRYPDQGAGREYPRLKDLSKALNDRQGIINITCHGVLESARGGRRSLAWQLKEQLEGSDAPIYLFRSYHIRSIDEDGEPEGAGPGPLVFGNACGAAGQGAGALGEAFGRQLFEVYGAAAYVGAFAKVTRHLAVDFAGRFYRNLLREADPLTIGQALWQTKKEYSLLRETDPSWLFYCLWGPPDTRFSCTSP